MITSLLGFTVFSEGSELLNWSSFCQTLIAVIAGTLVFTSSDPLTPKLQRLVFSLCVLIALGPMPHLYSAAVNYFDLGLPLFDQAFAYQIRIVVNVMVIVLGYSSINALAQARDALRLRDSIDYDMLTGARSRRFLFDADDENLRREVVENSYSTTVLLMDIDHFKQVNDQWGHHVGDEVLKHCVRQIRDVVRSTDAVIARYGGEEFCIVLPQLQFTAAVALAERVRERIQLNPYVSEKMQN